MGSGEGGYGGWGGDGGGVGAVEGDVGCVWLGDWRQEVNGWWGWFGWTMFLASCWGFFWLGGSAKNIRQKDSRQDLSVSKPAGQTNLLYALISLYLMDASVCALIAKKTIHLKPLTVFFTSIYSIHNTTYPSLYTEDFGSLLCVIKTLNKPSACYC